MTENYIFEIAVLTLDLNHHFNVLQVTSWHFKSVAYLANKKKGEQIKKTTKSKTKNIVNELIQFRVFKVIISLFNLVRSILRTLSYTSYYIACSSYLYNHGGNVQNQEKTVIIFDF